MPFLLSVLFQSGIDNPNQFNDFLLLGFAVMALIGFGYVLSLSLRQRNAQKDIRLLQELLQEDEE